jgi:hypothetical protein
LSGDAGQYDQGGSKNECCSGKTQDGQRSGDEPGFAEQINAAFYSLLSNAMLSIYL